MTADDYIRHVDLALRDLPWGQRRDLVADLRTHLAELPPDTALVARLGEPSRYAADLRAAAGLEPRRGIRAYVRARRPRNVILVTLLVVVISLTIGLAIGTLVWINRYQPLATGNVSFEPNAVDSPTGNGIYYVFRQGKRFRYGMTIWNSGRFAVRVLGVPIEYGFPIRYRLLMSGSTTYNYGGLPEPFTPFRPFDLAPGEERGIIFSGRFDEPCDSRLNPGGSEPRFGIPVRYRFLWHTATAEIAFPEQVTFVFGKNAAAGCPAKP